MRTTFALLACVACAAAFTTAEEKLILDAANTASYQTLTYTYDVWTWKATNIINGRRYTTIQQLDAVHGVTNFVLRLLLDGARAQCSTTTTAAGSYNGVYFTAAQAKRALEAANKAEYKGLVEVGDIYASKVKTLFQKRPVCSMHELKNINGFTYTPLTLLKRLTDDEQICYSDADCTSAPNRCEGISSVLGFGRCQTPDVPSVACQADSDCANGAGGVCIVGECKPTYLAHRFPAPAGQEYLTVPASGTKTVYFEVYGMATVPTSVEMSIDASGVTGDVTGLRIDLTDPITETFPYYSGTGSIPAQSFVGTTGDGSANGRFFVKVTGNGIASGKLRVNWLRIKSRYD